MTKRLFVPVIIIMFAMLAASVLAQQNGMEQEAEDKRFEASTLLSELNARNFENEEAKDKLMQANDAFDEGMVFFDSGDWQNAIERFDDAIYLGGEAVVREEAGEMIEEIGLDIPWGDGINIENIGQGIDQSALSLVLGITFISIFIILPVTYYFV